ncbi:hypothetical protein SDC9_207288 [bioreactor metagenome]|uniref:Uncharacterized protein n=1 Tax=bioreactor metagenome TaxID=1076179 RepID=A0A645J842_9ZZZZ
MPERFAAHGDQIDRELRLFFGLDHFDRFDNEIRQRRYRIASHPVIPTFEFKDRCV